MKAAELRESTDGELVSRARDLKRELWKARFANHTNQLDDTDKLRRLRRDIARVRTVLTERGISQIEGRAQSAQSAEETDNG